MKPNSILIIASFAWLLVSFWNRNDLPGNIDYIPSLGEEPRQSVTRERPFEVAFNDVNYTIEPEYAYEITGMVVSYRHHNEDNSRMHALANDHLNMLDVCVVWGDNPTNERLDKISFWNGIFTCNVKTRDQAAWESFDMYQLSNNHLISDDDFIRDQVRKVKVGLFMVTAACAAASSSVSPSTSEVRRPALRNVTVRLRVSSAAFFLLAIQMSSIPAGRSSIR